MTQVDDILNAPIEKEKPPPKHEFLYDWEATTYICHKCGKTIADYQYDSQPCPA